MLFNLFTPSYPVVDVNIPEGWWKSDSQLDIDFANNRSFNRKTAYKGRPSELLTYTSPSPKMVFSESGILKYAPHNLLTYSQEFDNAAWTKSSSTVVANQATAPDGTLTADLLYPSTTGTDRRVVRTVTVAARRGTVSFYAKAAGFNWVYIADPQANSSADTAWFDLSTGQVGTVGASIISADIIDVGNGWYRCSVVGPTDGTDVALLALADGDNTTTSTASGTNGVYIWGAMESCGSELFDYLATTSAAKYDLPIDYHPTTHAALGVLIEEQRTNLLTYSQEFGATGWNVQRCTVTGNAALGGDGTQTADAFVEDSASGSHQIYQVITKAASSIQYTCSVEIEPLNRTWCRIIASTSGEANFASVFYDLTDDGALGSSATGGSGFTNHSASIKLLPNGRYKLTLTFTSDTNTALAIGIKSADSNGSFGHVGNSLTAFYLWGAQLEAGAFATSYIQTGSAQVTRAADQVSLATSAFNFVDAPGTIVSEASTVFTASAVRTIALFTDGASDYIRPYFYPNRGGLNVVDGGAMQCDLAPGSGLTDNTMYKQAAAWATNDMAAVLDGGTVQTDTSGTMPSGMTILRIGAATAGGGGAVSRPLKRLTYWNTRKSNAELQGLSA